MFTKFKHATSFYVFNITNGVDPLKEYFNNQTEVIKYYLSQLEELNILLRYE